jgi:hypothetical protein
VRRLGFQGSMSQAWVDARVGRRPLRRAIRVSLRSLGLDPITGVTSASMSAWSTHCHAGADGVRHLSGLQCSGQLRQVMSR